MQILPGLILFLLVFSSSITNSGCANGASNAVANKTPIANTATKAPLPISSFEVVKTYKHDSNAFTQGLIFHNGFLYESTGEYGESSLRKVEIETGKVLQKIDVAREIFAEGITLLGGNIYQITWKERKCFVYDVNTFQMLKEFNYAGDGWGLTNDGTHLYMSDGTHVIRVIDPATFTTIRTITVFREDGRPLNQLNELEFVKGEIWANIWHEETIARIDPKSGKLLGWINMKGLSPDDVSRSAENTLNGIAYDASSDRVFMTGKNWRKLFEVKIKQP